MDIYKFRLVWLRRLVGTHGRQCDGSWCYGNYTHGKLGARTFYKFMFYIGSPILNSIIGYKRL